MGCGASLNIEEFSSFYAHYSLGSTPKALGKGSYGSVFLANAKHSSTTQSFAVKVQTSRRTATKKIEHEAKIWKLCASHRNVVHFVQMCQEADIYFMVMEACQRSLFDRLIDHPKWSWEQLAGDLHQLVSGLQHLHLRRVLHSDIKAENALYGGPDGKVLKLADFGLAVYITPSEGPLTRARGSRSYMAPEMLAGEGYAFPADMWSFGVLVYVILVGQFPIGQSKQTKSELTRNIIKVDKEPGRVTNLANKLKRAIATEQGKLDRRQGNASTEVSNRSSSEFQRVLPGPSSEGSVAPEELLNRHVSVQMKRLKVIEFIRLFLQRNPQERSSANEAMQSELFGELQSMRQEHRAMEVDSQLVIINRRALKRTDQKDSPQDLPAEEKPQNEEPRTPVATPDGPESPSTKVSGKTPPAPQTPAPPSGEVPKPPPLRRKSYTSGRLDSKLEDPLAEPKLDKPEPLRRRSFTASALAENSSKGQTLLQVPKGRRKSDVGQTPAPSGSMSQSAVLLEVQARDLRPSSENPEGHEDSLLKSSKLDQRAVPSPPPSRGSPAVAARAEPDDGPADGPAEELGERNAMTKTFSRMSSRGSRMGVRSMLSRDHSGFDLLHQLANTNVRGDSSWRMEESGLEASTLRQSRSRGLNSQVSGISMRSNRSNHRLGEDNDEVSPLRHSEARNSGDQAPAPGRSSGGMSMVEEHSEGPTPSKLQRRVSLGEMQDPSPAGRNLRRRVSFDEVLVMQHMVPLVPNQVQEPQPEQAAEADSD